MFAPLSWPCLSNSSMRNLPYREELLFMEVLALPNASSTGDEARIRFSIPSSPSTDFEAQYARCLSTFFAVSDLPAPDSPEITMDCDRAPRSPV